MQIKNCFKGLTILTLASVCFSSFADKAVPSSYIDDEGYCVTNIDPSNKIKYSQSKMISVPDVEGHILRIYQGNQKIHNTSLCNGDVLVSSEGYGTNDFIDQDGAGSGYVVFTTVKGDKLFLKVTGNSQKEKGKSLADGQETGRIIGGTGKYSKAEGSYKLKITHNWKKEIIHINTMTLRYKIPSGDIKNKKY